MTENTDTAPAEEVVEETVESPETPRLYVIGVVTSAGGRAADYDWNGIDLRVGDKCVVDCEGGQAFGSVTTPRRLRRGPVCEHKKIGVIIRKATQADIERAETFARKEKAAMNHCRECIVERGLEMQLSRVYYSFDGSKVIFFFTADGRVDFRELVRDMVAFTRTKVEMRQIGVRDEARMLGGCGQCGAQLCCSSFLSDFAPVSIRMAKDQNLSLNPAKISGVCGRLMCCLAYEYEHYKSLQEKSPRMGKSVVTPDGKVGKVIQLNLLKELVWVSFEDGSKGEFNAGELCSAKGYVPKKQPTPAPPPVPVVKEKETALEEFEDSAEGEITGPESPDKPSKKRQRRRKKKKKAETQDANPPVPEKPVAPDRPRVEKERPPEKAPAPVAQEPAGDEGEAESSRSRRSEGRRSRSQMRRKTNTDSQEI